MNARGVECILSERVLLQAQFWWKDTTTDLVYMCCRMDILAQLPGDLLWTILGFLDVRSLCTARLVCQHLRLSASGHLTSLHLGSEALKHAPQSKFSQFSCLTHLAVSELGSGPFFLRDLADPQIAPFVTHVDAMGSDAAGRFRRERTTCALSHLKLLPKLLSLRLPADVFDTDVLPLGLEELCLYGPILGDATLLTRFSGLTSLDIEVTGGQLGSLTGICTLRCLKLVWAKPQECGLSPGGAGSQC